jgi:tetratricopeptide (TPR) repeat protein
MSEPLPTDRPREIDAATDQDRDAKIEQLLLVGLDHYFASQFEQAINVWTRALFLDRSHARARAYIERARSAVAERQRESEELLHRGLAAFNRGESVQARRLLQDAVNHGAHADEALALLDRLNRIDQGGVPSTRVITSLSERSVLFVPEGEAAPRRKIGWAVAAAAVVVLAAVAAVLVPRLEGPLAWRPSITLPSAVPAPIAIAAGERPLPLPRRGEGALGRARVLAAGGRLRDALGALDRVRATDPEKAEADRLRGEIQQQLIALAAAATSAAGSAGPVP